ncbi:urea ABC transporter substrate-binding protein [Candidatus Nitronereus thalassa]|uniref:Urea ABC transporter substrate-binding protein n=1 Tax=Candidatus Nitronereus thalassa TaxID=3020898 RepID=A0ABU3K989_9BACT|nr:urea ABC transporter substrate-binding protein [Candidatus Nitronereus thalassa]MDT7042979.1 urea ABC transporter substrate-binding protein [Candidatus Nitronereus thalassa]
MNTWNIFGRYWIGLVFVALFGGLASCYFQSLSTTTQPIKVGILHSLTGTMAISERSVVDATLLAIEEINSKGGLLGRMIEPVIVDGESNEERFAELADQLIHRDKVSVIFGCWTSASRRRVKPVVESANHLLFYPVQYEGLEQSPNIIYTGAAPNQQIIPAVKWSFDNLGKKFFLIGSDYVFPKTANAIIKAQVNALGGEIVGEHYLPLGTTNVSEAIQSIIQTQPSVILNTINGDSNQAFFQSLQAASISAQVTPTMSFSIAEDELRTLGPLNMEGNYAVWNYFQAIESEENRGFVSRFQNRFGKDRVTDDPMEAGYFGLYLWAQAVEAAGSDKPTLVRQTLPERSFLAPEGIVSVDGKTNHTWKTVRVGQIKKDGQFKILWTSDHAIQAVPYPPYLSKAEWEEFLHRLYVQWDNQWANPHS